MGDFGSRAEIKGAKAFSAAIFPPHPRSAPFLFFGCDSLFDYLFSIFWLREPIS
jgi:hypothetical protein